MLPLANMSASQLAGRHEEEVQPFEESVAAAPAVAGTKSEGSPWAYLQKTYSNMDEAEQRTSETKGQHDCPQGDGPSFAELHAVNGAAMSVQVCKTQPACLHGYTASTVLLALHAHVLSFCRILRHQDQDVCGLQLCLCRLAAYQYKAWPVGQMSGHGMCLRTHGVMPQQYPALLPYLMQPSIH